MKRFKQYVTEGSRYFVDHMDAEWTEKHPHLDQHFAQATDLKELSKLKREAMKKFDANEPGWSSAGPLLHFHAKHAERLKAMDGGTRSAADARADLVLRTRDSAGKATARKF